MVKYLKRGEQMAEIRNTLDGMIGLKKIASDEHIIKHDYPLHWHEYYEIEYIVSGHGVYIIDGIEYNFSPNSLIFVTPVDFTSIKHIGEDIKIINISFSEDWISAKIINSVSSHAVVHDFDPYLCEKIHEELNSDKKFSSTNIRFLLGSVLIETIRKSTTNEAVVSHGKNSVISDMLNFVHTHFRDNPTLSDLSEYTGLSPNYLSKIFHTHIGMTFKAYTNDLKLKYASVLLKQTDADVSDICFSCGFNTFAHFFRAFRQKYGTTPKNFRKQNENN